MVKSNVIPFKNPHGRTMPTADPAMNRAKAFANYYGDERRRGVDPETAHRNASKLIMADFDRLIATLRTTMNDVR
ncbi:hypothetical protein [Rhodopseudomonas palustris]|uniref:hypothetical protein n=1 Tax=Rhodopseudomonas palustris TaxID=1076 RepID=UPI0005A1A09F|nr:hypothetical protein [Rhodopseudomonas palustris]